MKTKLTLVLCTAALVTLGGQAFAKDPQKLSTKADEKKTGTVDTVRLEITDRLAVRAVVDSKYKTCQLVSSGWIQDVSHGVVADSSSGDAIARRFLQRLLSEEIRCTTKVRPRAGGTTNDAPGWSDPLPLKKPESLSDLKDKSVANIQMFGPTYLFPSEDPLAALVANILVKEDASCKMVNPSAEALKEDNCKLVLSGGSFKIVPNGQVPAGATRIELRYPAKGATKQEVQLPLGSCDYTLNGSLSVLVQGARKQRISLAYQTGWDAKCSAFLYEARTLVEGEHTIHLKRAASTVPTQGEVFDAEPIPAALTPGVHNLQVKSAGGVVGTLKANVIAPPAMKENSKIQVKYDVQGTDPDRIPSFDAAAGESEVALVNPRKNFPSTLTNGWDLTVPAPLSHGLTESTPLLANLSAASSVPMDPLTSDLASVVQTVSAWKVASSGLVSLKIRDCSSNGNVTQWGDPGCILTSPLDTLVLSIPDVAGKIQPVFSLADYHEVKELEVPAGSDCLFQNSCAEKPRRWVAEPVVEVAIPLADKAEIQSLALPVRDALVVECTGSYATGDDVTVLQNGDTGAVANNALEDNKCTLKQRLNKKGVPAYDLNLYGPQSMVVTVQQQGGEKVERAVTFTAKSNTFKLVAPPGTKADGKVYTVEVRLTNKAESLVVKYRNGTLDPKLSDTAVSLGEHQLVVYLRPHGAFGHGNISKDHEWGFRQYLSLAAELGGIRFPASARDLKDTSQPTTYQLVAPRPGLLMSIEPWDYNTGTNPAHIGPLPLPIALQTGIHVTHISDDDIRMSFLLGASLNLPLIDNVPSQLNTQASLGFYYENDLRGGNYFLMSLGFKLGSLFSSTSK